VKGSEPLDPPLTPPFQGGELALPADPFDALDFDLIRSDKPDAATNAEASAFLCVTAKGQDPQVVGRAFSNAVVEMVLSSYPGFYCTTPPQEATPYGVYWPALVPASVPQHKVVLADGTRLPIPPSPTSSGTVSITPPAAQPSSAPDAKATGPTKRLPLGTIFGARSGDKGGNANVGVWARSEKAYAFLASFLSIERFKQLVPEAENLAVRRYEFPHLRALNFVVVGLLGEGVSSSTRPDAQAKSLGEYLRSRLVDLPAELLVSV